MRGSKIGLFEYIPRAELRKNFLVGGYGGARYSTRVFYVPVKAEVVRLWQTEVVPRDSFSPSEINFRGRFLYLLENKGRSRFYVC